MGIAPDAVDPGARDATQPRVGLAVEWRRDDALESEVPGQGEPEGTAGPGIPVAAAHPATITRRACR